MRGRYKEWRTRNSEGAHWERTAYSDIGSKAHAIASNTWSKNCGRISKTMKWNRDHNAVNCPHLNCRVSTQSVNRPERGGSRLRQQKMWIEQPWQQRCMVAPHRSRRGRSYSALASSNRGQRCCGSCLHKSQLTWWGHLAQRKCEWS